MNRRNSLKSLILAAGAAALGTSNTLATPHVSPARKRVLRVAHITDVHIFSEKNAPHKLAKCFHAIQSLKDPVDVVFNTGDTIFDALAKEKSEVTNQWNVWNGIIKSDNSLPIKNCIGNHDVWGLASAKEEALYGKSWAVDQLQLAKRYYSFDQNGWHFIVLDSTHPNPDSTWYTGKIDEEQFNWLQDDLKRTTPKTPILVLSHIPILSAAVFFDGELEKDGNWYVPGAWMHSDAVKIANLFYEHKNVKVCISGHLHLVDRVEYNGVTYLCNGAVSGGWWDKEYYKQTKAGFAVINLYNDGTFENEYMPYTA